MRSPFRIVRRVEKLIIIYLSNFFLSMISIKRLFLAATLFALIGVTMTGCSFLDNNPADDQGDFGDDFSFAEGECFEFVYPIQVEFNGEAQEVPNAEALDALCEQDETGDALTFVYPVQITLEGATDPIILENDEQMDEIFYDCYGDECPDDYDEDDSQDS